MAGHKSFISFGAPSRLNPWESMWGAVAAVCGSAGLFVCLSLERAESRWEKKRSQSELWMGDTRPKVYAHLCFFRLDSKLGSSALVCQNKPRHFGHSTTPLLHQWRSTTAPLESTPCNSHAASSSANGHHIKSRGDPKSHGEKRDWKSKLQLPSLNWPIPPMVKKK